MIVPTGRDSVSTGPASHHGRGPDHNEGAPEHEYATGTGEGGRLGENDGLARLVLVATSSWKALPSADTCDRHARFLDQLLQPRAAGAPALCCLPADVRRAALGSASKESTGPAPDPAAWVLGGTEEEATARRELLTDLRRVCFDRLGSPEDAVPTGLLGLRHRVHLTGEQVDALLGAAAPTGRPPLQVCVDVRFRQFYDFQLSMQLSLWVWSHRPRSPHHVPAAAPEIIGSGHDRLAYRDGFLAVRDAFEAWMQAAPLGFRTESTRILKTQFMSPLFWVATPLSAGRTAAGDWIDDGGRLSVPHLVRPFLDADDLRDAGIAVSVLGGDVLAARKLVHEPGGSRPTYLLLPGRPPAAGGDPAGDDAFVEQEDRTRSTIRHLSDLETDVATRLWDDQSDLEIWDNHLDTYQHVADRGSVLWDAMAGHLLRHRLWRLGRTHRSIELIHQTMLQGVADADGIDTRVATTRARMVKHADDLADNYDAVLGERTRPGVVGVREAVLERGPFRAAATRARQIADKAERVSRNYRDLIAAISDAFEERRVREAESLDRAAFPLSLLVGLGGLVTVLDTMFSLQEPATYLTGPAVGSGDAFGWSVSAFWPRLAVQGLGVLLVIGIGLGGRVYLRRGKLGSGLYRTTYAAVWDVLRYCSTDHLATVARRLDPDAPLSGDGLLELAELSRAWEERARRCAADWSKIDAAFASAYAAAWDEVGNYHLRGSRGDLRHDDDSPAPAGGRALQLRWSRYRSAGRDLQRLAVMIEKWSLRTFLITERPVELWKADLPRLTILYRYALKLDDPDAGKVVSDMDFFFSFARWSHDLRWADVELLHKQLDGDLQGLREEPDVHGVPGRVSAVKLLARVEAVVAAATRGEGRARP